MITFLHLFCVRHITVVVFKFGALLFVLISYWVNWNCLKVETHENLSFENHFSADSWRITRQPFFNVNLKTHHMKICLAKQNSSANIHNSSTRSVSRCILPRNIMAAHKIVTHITLTFVWISYIFWPSWPHLTSNFELFSLNLRPNTC